VQVEAKKEEQNNSEGESLSSISEKSGKFCLGFK
jgi:hypothetical protein